MHLIEPCCAPKQLLALRSKLGDNGTAFWHGYGDLSIAELLPQMLTRYTEVDLIIAAPSLPDMATEIIRKMMERQWRSMDGKGMVYNIRQLTLIADMRKKKSPLANKWLYDNPFDSRLLIHNTQQGDTAIILPDIAFFGNINLTYSGHFTAVATKNTSVIADVRKTLLSLG